MINPVGCNGVYAGYAYKNNLREKSECRKNLSQNVINVQENPALRAISTGNVLQVSFKGQLQDPNYPSIQFKIRGVSHHQKDFGSKYSSARDRSIEKLADSNWQDGQELKFEIADFKEGTKILLKDSKFGEVGRVPDSITPSLLKLLRKHGKDFQFQLSNVVAGTSKGAPTIGLRANLIYTGRNATIKEKVERTFDYLLNSDYSEIKDVVMLYQPKSTPKDVLERILDCPKGSEYRRIIDNICSEINNPNNKNILLLGHCLPDGDTIGCVLGMHAAIKATYPDKKVVCSIDDKLPGLYRDKLPGINLIQKPYDTSSSSDIEEQIAQLKSKPQTFVTRNQIRTLEKELNKLRQHSTPFDVDIKQGDEKQNYDLVILMDVPSPSRFSNAYKEYINNAGKVIYIDHHRERYDEWNSSYAQMGLDMEKIREANLALVVPEVPATTELVTVIASEAGLMNKLMKNVEYAKQFVAGIVSGTSSDTGCFARSANYTPEDIEKPVQQRRNYLPEGLCKWLIDKMGSKIDKKWIRENIVYDIADKTSSITAVSPRQKMINYSLKNQKIFEDTGLGIITMSYDEMYDIWQSSRKFDKQVTFGDVQNSIKYSEVMGALREAPKAYESDEDEIQPYSSLYEDDKIAVLLIQDKENGKIQENSELATTNSIRMSFRSQSGTFYAEMLASLFNGGGHGSAAGGRIELEGVNFDSPLVIKVDGKKEYSFENIYEALMYNYEVKMDSSLTEKQKFEKMHKFEPIIDSDGKPISDLLNGIVKEFRCNSF